MCWYELCRLAVKSINHLRPDVNNKMSYFQIELDVNCNILLCQELFMFEKYHDGS